MIGDASEDKEDARMPFSRNFTLARERASFNMRSRVESHEFGKSSQGYVRTNTTGRVGMEAYTYKGRHARKFLHGFHQNMLFWFCQENAD